MYNKKVLEKFRNPKFVGKIENPSGIGEVTNFKCGDAMKLYIKVENGIIKDIRYNTYGCAAAIASSDTLCELAVGKTLEQLKKIKRQDIIKKLGQLPPQKLHCSILAIEALKKAIKDYEKHL